MTKFDQRYHQIYGNQYNAEQIYVHQAVDSTGNRLNRQRMIDRVRAIWITGFLEPPPLDEPSLTIPLIKLDLQSCPKALTNPWHRSVQEMDRASRPLPHAASITDVYEQAAGPLLLVGDPGVGKTTLLLELARDLLDRAEDDETQPIPVLFHLNEWARQRLPLADWLIVELDQKYQVPKLVGQPWVKNDQLLLLLDGFDEVEEKYREACLQAIEEYRRDHGLVPLVVCSRTAAYMEQKRRLAFQLAVTIQPLSPQQVTASFQTLGAPLAPAYTALQQDPILRELVTTPLLLHIYMQAYYGQTVEEGMLTGSMESRRQQLIAAYIKRMFERRRKLTTTTPQQMRVWLSWLAAVMKERSLTEFYLEMLQPDWLVDRYIRLLYRVGAVLSFGLIYGLMGIWLPVPITPSLPGRILLYALGGIVARLTLGSSSKVLGSLAVAPIRTIVPVEKVSLTWGNLLLLAFSLIGFAFTGPFEMLSFLLVALPGKQLEKRLRLSPNQGTWASGKNGLTLMLYLGTFVLALAILVMYGLHQGDGILKMALFTVPLFFIAFGGTAFLQHFLVRFLLWRTKYLPRNIALFLNEAVQRLFLRKVGGGYVFSHRLILDYFAEDNTLPLPKEDSRALVHENEAGKREKAGK